MENHREESAGSLDAIAKEPEEHPLVATLRDLQPDEMSPKEALERIYHLKKLV